LVKIENSAICSGVNGWRSSMARASDGARNRASIAILCAS
jgi:hypothetical protein